MLLLASEYEDEQSTLNQEEKKVKQELSDIATQDAGIGAFTEIVRKSIRVRKLTPEIIRQFVDHIDIHQAEKTKGESTQQIDIYFSCVGKIELPDAPKARAKEITMPTREGVVVKLANEARESKCAS